MAGENPSVASEQERIRLLIALRESEFLRELGELLASSLDIDHILKVLVRRTTEVCEVERCAVWLFEEHRGVFLPAAYHLSSQHLDSQAIKAASHIWYHSNLPADNAVMRRLINEKGILFQEDLRSEPSMRFVADTFLVRSVLMLALVRDGQVVGMMSLDDPGQSRSFSPEQIQLARAIAQQAAIAIGNGRLYQQAQMERRRAEQLIKRSEAVNQVATAINTGRDLSEVLDIALDYLVQELDASGGLIVLLEGETPVVASSKHLKIGKEEIPAGMILSELTHCQQAVRTGMPLLTSSEQTTGREKSWYEALGLGHIMVIPLMAGTMHKSDTMTNAEKRLQPYCLGFAITHYNHEPRQPSHSQFAFAQDIAAQCALAVEKHRLQEDAQQAAALAMERANTLEAVFQSLTEGITVVTQENEVLVGNKAAARFLGLPVNATEQLDVFLQRFPSFTINGQPIDAEDFPVSRALRGERIRGERFVTHRADGARRILEVNVSPMYDNERRQIGVVSAFRDITEQVEAEAHIQHALETMLSVAEAVSGLTDIYDIQSRVLQLTLSALHCERGVIYLYDNEQQRFTPLLSTGFISDNEQQWLNEQNRWLSPSVDEFQEFKEQLIQGHAILVPAQQFRRQTGGLSNPFQHTMILAAPITHNERLLGLMLLDRSSGAEQSKQQHNFSLWDMAIVEGLSQLAGLAIEQAYLQDEATNARANEAAMREANALKDEFMSITAHEFRTPLTVILAHCQMLLRLSRRSGELSQNDDMIESLSTIEKQTHLLTDIVNSFLEVTQINRGQLALKTEEVDLAEIARQVIANYGATSPNHEISCIIEPCPYKYIVEGDSVRLLQVLANLVQNAIKYSPQGGPVTVWLRQRILSRDITKEEAANPAIPPQTKRLIEVSVEDKGMGVPKDAQAHLFERFYRASNTQGSKVRGIGLGLYLVAQLLHLHGGTIRVESSGIPGEGSRFIFTLPVLERDTVRSE
ncbi:MAG TPA: GAF domain-containing protein [Ktedonobacteraceae bacterium]|nr:GAF domain-containing protein [Ktedonobacteraceae bacterium]